MISAVCIARGGGVPQDDTQALYWYRQAAEQGDAMAQNHLGSIYTKGLGVPQDYTQALYWYRRAAEQGQAVAQASLGFRYHRGGDSRRITHKPSIGTAVPLSGAGHGAIQSRPHVRGRAGGTPG